MDNMGMELDIFEGFFKKKMLFYQSSFYFIGKSPKNKIQQFYPYEKLNLIFLNCHFKPPKLSLWCQTKQSTKPHLWPWLEMAHLILHGLTCQQDKNINF